MRGVSIEMRCVSYYNKNLSQIKAGVILRPYFLVVVTSLQRPLFSESGETIIISLSSLEWGIRIVGHFAQKNVRRAMLSLNNTMPVLLANWGMAHSSKWNGIDDPKDFLAQDKISHKSYRQIEKQLLAWHSPIKFMIRNFSKASTKIKLFILYCIQCLCSSQTFSLAAYTSLFCPPVM